MERGIFGSGLREGRVVVLVWCRGSGGTDVCCPPFHGSNMWQCLHVLASGTVWNGRRVVAVVVVKRARVVYVDVGCASSTKVRLTRTQFGGEREELRGWDSPWRDGRNGIVVRNHGRRVDGSSVGDFRESGWSQRRLDLPWGHGVDGGQLAVGTVRLQEPRPVIFVVHGVWRSSFIRNHCIRMWRVKRFVHVRGLCCPRRWEIPREVRASVRAGHGRSLVGSFDSPVERARGVAGSGLDHKAPSLPVHRPVPPILHRVVAAVAKSSCNLRPALPHFVDHAFDHQAFFGWDGFMVQSRLQVLVEPLTALLRGAEVHLLWDADPVVRSLSVDELKESLVLFRDPRASSVRWGHCTDRYARI